MQAVYNFDSIAENYDQWYADEVGQKIFAQESQAIAKHLASPSTHRSVLEAGCGTGFWSQWLVKQGYDVLGIDISEKMVAQAQHKHIANSRFVQGDIRDFHTHERFDIALFITTLEFIPEYEKALFHAANLLKPGGQIVVGTLNQYSIMGLQRKYWPWASSVYKEAHFFDMWELQRLLGKFGRAQVDGATYALGSSWFLPLADILESIGQSVFPAFGNLLVGSVFIR